MNCLVCESKMVPDIVDLTYRCMACGFFSSELPVEINSVYVIDEDVRENALYPLRKVGIETLMKEFRKFINRGSSILDVGCAHGWFITAAIEAGYPSFGIEPDHKMADRLRASKIDFVEGYFPDALSAEQKYDIVTFHDVFEHLPNLDRILNAVRDHLNPNGLLVINLPVTDGLFFRVARQLAFIGLVGPLARLWQKGLPSPHLSYFSRTNLLHYVTHRGFKYVRGFDLPSVTTEKLWRRIRYDTSLGFVRALGIFVGVHLLVPLTRVTKSDARCFVFTKL